MTSALATPLTLGSLQLPNRLVMAPLTRMRTNRAGVPGQLNVEYYTQRASMGLIVTEGAYPAAVGQGFAYMPGIVTPEQIAGWRRVSDSVHAAGGRIFMQIMHAGRATHPDLTGGHQPVAPSAIAIDGQMYTYHGKAQLPVPRPLDAQELPGVIEEFVQASRNAMTAGLDGVELHGANGYLLQEFLAPGSNHRTDQYGGSAVNRARFVIEVIRAVAAAIGAEKVGLRISPEHQFHDAWETDHDDVVATYTALVEGINDLGLAYLSVLHPEPAGEFLQGLRARFGGPFLTNTGLTPVPTSREESLQLLEDGWVDGVVVGRAAIANPDLVRRWIENLPENQPDGLTFYSQHAAGYTDYPFHQD